MRITILGPNGINDASFHAHAYGCADIKKAKYRPGTIGESWDADFESRSELILDLFADFIDEQGYDEDDALAIYGNDVRVFPCVKWAT